MATWEMMTPFLLNDDGLFLYFPNVTSFQKFAKRNSIWKRKKSPSFSRKGVDITQVVNRNCRQIKVTVFPNFCPPLCYFIILITVNFQTIISIHLFCLIISEWSNLDYIFNAHNFSCFSFEEISYHLV